MLYFCSVKALVPAWWVDMTQFPCHTFLTFKTAGSSSYLNNFYFKKSYFILSRLQISICKRPILYLRIHWTDRKLTYLYACPSPHDFGCDSNWRNRWKFQIDISKIFDGTKNYDQIFWFDKKLVKKIISRLGSF